ncbi:MAG: cupin domain-containing protein [Acidobacteriaceae bacterium]
MSTESETESAPLTRRHFLSVSGAAIAAVTAAPLAAQTARPAGKQIGSSDHHLPNEQQPGPNNTVLAAQNPDSVWPPQTDNGSVSPFKYSFDLSHKEIDSGGWTRQVTVRDLPVSKAMAGVEMRLTNGGIRELHWHVSAEWAFVTYGNARITAVDPEGRSFVNDVTAGDLWIFPGGVPHSIQGLGPDGCKFLLVFNDGNFNEFDTFLLSEWFAHTPKEVLAKNFNVPESTFDNVPTERLYIFQSDPPRPLAEEQKQAGAVTGDIDNKFVFRPSSMAPTKVTRGGEVKIIDKKLFPATDISAAIVRLKPGGLRELHWHPLSDEWQYYVSGKGRMTIFAAGGKARTMDFQEGDVGYIEVSRPHYIENTGDEDLVFLEVFPTGMYQDISAAEWLAHTPTRLVNEHLHTGEEFLENIPKKESVVVPL